MSDLLKSVEDIKKFGRMFAGICELGAELEKLQSLQNAALEAKRVKEECEKSSAELVEKIKINEVKYKLLCDNHIAQVVKNGKELDLLLDNAEKKKREILNGANSSAEVILNNAEAAMKKAQNDIKLMKENAKSLELEISQKQKDLSSLKAELERLKNKF